MHLYSAKAANPIAIMPATPKPSAGSITAAPLLDLEVDLLPDAVPLLVPPVCPLLLLTVEPVLEAFEGLRYDSPAVRTTC